MKFKTDFIPENEFGVIILWGRLYPYLGLELLECNHAFPDFIMKTPHGKIIRVELEFKSSNFLTHKHPIDQCDLIICWIKDKKNLDIEIIELRHLFKLKDDLIYTELDRWRNLTDFIQIREIEPPKPRYNGRIRHLHIILEDDEHEVLVKQKGEITWKEFLMKCGDLFAKAKKIRIGVVKQIV